MARGIAAIAAPEFATEGFNFSLRPYVDGDPDNEVLSTAQNYTVPLLGVDRFPNIDGVAPGQSFQVQGSGATAYHYRNTMQDFAGAPEETRNYTLVRTGTAGLPPLRYKWFYFDGCNTGRDYFESFQHGSFFFTAAAYGNTSSTKLFVENIIEGRQEQETVEAMNNNDTEQPFNQFYPFN